MSRKALPFDSEEKFVEWTMEHARLQGMKDVEALIRHERAHFEKARELGYDAFYQVYGHFYGDEGPGQCIVQAFQVNYHGDRPTPQHLIEIMLAPEAPSADDLAIVERCRRELDGNTGC